MAAAQALDCKTAKNRPTTFQGVTRVSQKAHERPLFHLVLRPEPRTDAERALQALLKIALRRFGLRCISLGLEPPK
jgi:hypothetical protein